jgi:hypothetical protein
MMQKQLGAGADHLETITRYLDQHRERPGVALMLYLKSIKPAMSDDDCAALAGELVDTTMRMIQTEYCRPQPGVRRLAGIIAATLISCGVELGMDAALERLKAVVAGREQ